MIINNKTFLYNEVETHYNEKRRFILTYNKIYQVFYSWAQGQYYAQCIYNPSFNNIKFAKKGTYNFMTAQELNQAIKFELVRE